MLDFNWYKELVKPWLSPPSWVFTPVWTILYIMIFSALAVYLVKYRWMDKSHGIMWFAVQMLLNIMWTPVFFGLKNTGLALVIILLLDYTVFRTIRSFYDVSAVAGRLMIPYFVWILFATYLTAGMFFLN